MTITYNASSNSMKDYVIANLYKIKEENLTQAEYWYSASPNKSEPTINIKDVFLLVSSIKEVINKDFDKIKKLTKYLKNVANILNILELPII
jgi:hypothetical protein